MQQAGFKGPVVRRDRARTLDDGGSAGAWGESLRSESSELSLAASLELPNSLTRLKALISTHRALLSKIRDRNKSLEVDNARMETELGGRSRAGPDPGDASHRDDASILGETDSLKSIESYLRDTLGQTLWALDARAARLEEQVTDADRQQARRVTELTRVAYDQLRSLIAQLYERSND